MDCAFGMWPMPRNMKLTGSVQSSMLRSYVFHQLQALDVFFFHAEDFFDHGGVAGTRWSGWAIARSSMMREARKSVRAVDERDFAGEAGEEERFLHGGVAAADDGNGSFPEAKKPSQVAQERDAEADQCLLGRQIEPACRWRRKR